MNDQYQHLANAINRRTFMSRAGLGLGAVAFSGLLADEGIAACAHTNLLNDTTGILPGLPHFPPRVKRVIFLCMAGGPSHLETFDYKPGLKKIDGQPMPSSFTDGQPIAQLQGKALKAMRPLAKFRPHGESGLMFSDFLPWQSRLADDICVIKSLVTEQINHDPAHTFMNTGTAISGRPSMGAWINYGLGSDSRDLPGFVVMTSVGGRIRNRSRPGSGRPDFCPASFKAWSLMRRVIRLITFEIRLA